ncbi:YwpF family protein [Psychrobacillus sp.]|uniref:YwpF family protein n=1 Tax=Psychrobacillus sp. TaxID=1871623 RepID=UPI0028BE9BD2|nr:YwpF family protein [Psychrobacillus sp.]
MKTFKLISVDIIRDSVVHSVPLEDGIIINQENTSRSWILELFVDKQHKPLFSDLQFTNEKITAKAVISYPENEPANFEVVVYSVKEIGEQISVLLRGTLNFARRKYAESLLSELIKEGLTGEDLLSRFEHDMKVRPLLKRD